MPHTFTKTFTLTIATLALAACGGDSAADGASRAAKGGSESTVVTSAQFIEACTKYYAEAPTSTLTSSGTRIANKLRETIVARGPEHFCQCIDGNMGPVLGKLMGKVNALATDVDFDEDGPTARLILKTREDGLTYYPAQLEFELKEESYTLQERFANAPRNNSMINQVTNACEAPIREELYD